MPNFSTSLDQLLNAYLVREQQQQQQASRNRQFQLQQKQFQSQQDQWEYQKQRQEEADRQASDNLLKQLLDQDPGLIDTMDVSFQSDAYMLLSPALKKMYERKSGSKKATRNYFAGKIDDAQFYASNPTETDIARVRKFQTDKLASDINVLRKDILQKEADNYQTPIEKALFETELKALQTELEMLTSQRALALQAEDWESAAILDAEWNRLISDFRESKGQGEPAPPPPPPSPPPVSEEKVLGSRRKDLETKQKQYRQGYDVGMSPKAIQEELAKTAPKHEGAKYRATQSSIEPTEEDITAYLESQGLKSTPQNRRVARKQLTLTTSTPPLLQRILTPKPQPRGASSVASMRGGVPTVRF